MEIIPPKLYKPHPLISQKYILPTPSIDEFYKRVKKCIRIRTPGAIIYAHPRFGKTYGIRYLENVLDYDFPRIVVRGFLCHHKKNPSEDAFFGNLNDAFGHKTPYAGSIARKRSRLINMLKEVVDKSEQNILVIFADEAQKLVIDQYEWLREVHDEMGIRDIRVVTFLVGQHTLRNQKTAFREAGETQIVGRFMLDELKFRGLLSVDDAATCLEGYDSSCYPEDSDWCYTRYFFPKAYANGLRMVEQAATLWQAFSEIHENSGFRFDTEIPMQYFARAVEIAFIENQQNDSDQFCFSPAIWDEAVHDSNYVEAQQTVQLGLDDNDTLW